MPDLLFELGSEEIPAGFVVPALEQIETTFKESCRELGITHGPIRRFGTPRRLAIFVSDLIERTADQTKHQQGPSVAAAFDAAGVPTKVALKFAESVGVPVEKLERLQTAKGVYLAARIIHSGQATIDLLPRVLRTCIQGLVFPKSMRWGDVEATYARPLHWIVALFGTSVVPVKFADVTSGRVSRGHRFLAAGPITIETPNDYERLLESAHVVVDIAKRRQLLVDRLAQAATTAGATILADADLTDQVVNLVEQPIPVVGSFDSRHLDLPPEVLIQEMKVHQRYFPLVSSNGNLAPRFIAVSNTPVEDEKLSIKGYERVLRARLTDGRFFFDEDRRMSLSDWLDRLQRRTWVATLGSMAEKTARIEVLAAWLTKESGNEALLSAVGRAARLCKADLETGMVNEFPELQGAMGREYAKSSGETDEVALAIFEHYLPRTASDSLPTQDAGALIGLADRLDSLCGLFGIGKKPTGSKDDFSLRRAAISFIRIVLGRRYHFSLEAAIEQALQQLQPKLSVAKKPQAPEAIKAQVLEFFHGRLESLWRENYRADVVDAILAAGFDDLVDAELRLKALAAQVDSPDFASVVGTFKRVTNIVAKQGAGIPDAPINLMRLSEAAEKALHDEVGKIENDINASIRAADFAAALGYMIRLKTPVDNFFNEVMVIADDRELRENRIRLLMRIRSLFGAIADFSKLHA